MILYPLLPLPSLTLSSKNLPQEHRIDPNHLPHGPPILIPRLLMKHHIPPPLIPPLLTIRTHFRILPYRLPLPSFLPIPRLPVPIHVNVLHVLRAHRIHADLATLGGSVGELRGHGFDEVKGEATEAEGAVGRVDEEGGDGEDGAVGAGEERVGWVGLGGEGDVASADFGGGMIA